MCLTTVRGILMEQGRVYRLWTNGRLRITEMHKAISSLAEMRTSAEHLPEEPPIYKPPHLNIIGIESGYHFKTVATEDGVQQVLERTIEHAPALEDRSGENGAKAERGQENENAPIKHAANAPDFSLVRKETEASPDDLSDLSMLDLVSRMADLVRSHS